MLQDDDFQTFARTARRWADAAWVRGWHAHALDVLDHALWLAPDDFKLFRKRGAFYLLSPDPWLRDADRGFSDLRRACELCGWRADLVGWAAELLAECGAGALAEALAELARQAGAGDDGGEQPDPEADEVLEPAGAGAAPS